MIHPALSTLLAVTLLVAVQVAVMATTGVTLRRESVVAVLRAVVQLAVLSFVLSGVITNPWWVAVALAVMFAVASVTSARRLGWSLPRFATVAGAMASGIAVTLVIVFATGALELSPRYALAIGGIITGNAMTASTLAGRRVTHSIAERFNEVEAWLAIGATNRQATRDIARTAIREALIPSIDMTKTTGLVTLPGAFVGAIFGGASPVEAGYFQLIVLAGILTAGTITATVVALTLAPHLPLPRDFRTHKPQESEPNRGAERRVK